MTIGQAPDCCRCKHLDENSGMDMDDEVVACRAFPDGIPAEIFFDYGDHTIPWPGDHGIQFQPISDTTEAGTRKGQVGAQPR